MARRTAGAVLLVAGLLAAACGGEPGDGRVTLEFFQFKPEAIEAFDAVIADFEAEHPGIRVRQNHVPDAETALRTRLVREDVPDVMALGGNATFGELAQAGVFHDFADDPILEAVNPAFVEILGDLGTSSEGAVHGIPFASNANGVIYNKDLFAAHEVDLPATWDDFLAAAETFEAAGVTPIYATLVDAWTAQVAFNSLTASLQPPDFFDELDAERTSFREEYDDVAERLRTVFGLAQRDRFSRGYEDGNAAFAGGEVAMYLQGSWAVPAIEEHDPAFEIGMFALPADEAEETVLVSGVDVVITMAADVPHPDESRAFLAYLMRPEVVQAYADEQSAVPTLEGMEPPDPVLAELQPYFDDGRLVGFTDHRIPPAIPLGPIIQQYLIDEDAERFLASLDNEWAKVARRRL
jgi:raffinose/stachyose/melibiose transport system substrate-binding protein